VTENDLLKTKVLRSTTGECKSRISGRRLKASRKSPQMIGENGKKEFDGCWWSVKKKKKKKIFRALRSNRGTEINSDN
jgi:hypothetical protein